MSEYLHTDPAAETVASVLAACNLSADSEHSPFQPPFNDEWDPFWQKISASEAAVDALQRLNKYATQKHAILRHFFADSVDMVQKGDDIVLLSRRNGAQLGAQSELPFIIEELRLTKQEAYIRGRVKVLAGAKKEDVAVHAMINGAETPCVILPGDPSDYKGDVLKCLAVSFEHRISRKQLQESMVIRFAVIVNGLRWVVSKLRFGEFAALGDTYAHHYYARYGWAFLHSRATLQLRRVKFRQHIQLEREFLDELKEKPSPMHDEAYRLRRYCFLRSLLPSREIWLVSDRYNKADDSGEAFFRYLCAHRDPRIQVWFVIDSSSPYYAELKKVGRVISPDGFKFRQLVMRARFLISSHSDKFTVHPLGDDAAPVRDWLAGHQFVFLPHGITRGDISNHINRTRQNIRLWVTTARPEYQSILHNHRYQFEDAVRLTGLPRHDRLYDNSKRYITLMPTWRKYLFEEKVNGVDSPAATDAFVTSQFFQFYNALLNHPRLLAAAKDMGYQLRFMPHPLVHPLIHLFTHNEQVYFYPYDTPYRDVLAESSLIMTDYSSAEVDFVYMRKPVVYCHFDKDEFTSGKHTYTPGYFDYETMGFGEVTYDLESLVDCMIDYMKNDCKMKPEYVARADAFFGYNDRNNCRRVLDEIKKLRRQ